MQETDWFSFISHIDIKCQSDDDKERDQISQNILNVKRHPYKVVKLSLAETHWSLFWLQIVICSLIYSYFTLLYILYAQWTHYCFCKT